MAVRGYFVQYRFILPDSIKHSSYTYQKLFRAIYGYTQAVHKSSGKNYSYHRSGILSDFPYLRPGKNCVIIPPAAFQSLQDFFKTGHNPTHNWETKGEWKCTYFLNEKDIAEKEIVLALENLIARKYVGGIEGPATLLAEMKRVKEKGSSPEYRSAVVKEAQTIVDLDWFKQTYQMSQTLIDFYELYKHIKNPQSQPVLPSQVG
ncbi:Uncharacterised protein [uncultured archaeon]|nr:Uncharacterised protein [uncultured archaeon]